MSAANQHLTLCITDGVEIFENSDLLQTVESRFQSVLNPCSFFKTPCISCSLRASCRCEQKCCSWVSFLSWKWRNSAGPALQERPDFILHAAIPILHQYFWYVLSGNSMNFQLQNSSFLKSLHVQRENRFFASLENETFFTGITLNRNSCVWTLFRHFLDTQELWKLTNSPVTQKPLKQQGGYCF